MTSADHESVNLHEPTSLRKNIRVQVDMECLSEVDKCHRKIVESLCRRGDFG